MLDFLWNAIVVVVEVVAAYVVLLLVGYAYGAWKKRRAAKKLAVA